MKKSAALPPGVAAHPQVTSLWIGVQARLMMAIEEVVAADGKAMWIAIGVRKPRTVANNLSRELQCAKVMAESMGIFATDMDLYRRISRLPRLSYRFNLKELQSTYEVLLSYCGSSDKIANWIKSRMSIHEFQLQQLI
jgi:hypothetical protein